MRIDHSNMDKQLQARMERAGRPGRGMPEMTEEGLVRQVAGTMAQVETTQTEACNCCEAKGACSTMGGLKQRVVMAQNDAQAGVGDRVLLALPRRGVMGAGFLVYIVPLIALLAGAYLGKLHGVQWGLGSTNASVILGMGALVLSWAALRPISKNLAKRPELTVRIVRILEKAAPQTEGEPAPS